MSLAVLSYRIDYALSSSVSARSHRRVSGLSGPSDVRMRASTAIADAWKRIFSVLLCSVVFAFLCGLGCVLSSPIVPQEIFQIYGVALGVAVALLRWTWP